MDGMNQVRLRFILFPVFMLPLGIVFGSYSAESHVSRAGLTCVQEKIVSFGFTSPRITLAEMAAIITWQDQAKKVFPGYGKWALAQRRSMRCRKYKSSTHYQCQTSATPCRMKKGKEEIS